MPTLTTFRAEKDRFFGRHAQSPLTAAQKRAFKRPNYFPENPALRLQRAMVLPDHACRKSAESRHPRGRKDIQSLKEGKQR